MKRTPLDVFGVFAISLYIHGVLFILFLSPVGDRIMSSKSVDSNGLNGTVLFDK